MQSYTPVDSESRTALWSTASAFVLCAILLWLMLIFASCTSWQSGVRDGLAVSHRTMVALTPLLETTLRARCGEKAGACAEAGDTVCQPLVACQALRAGINRGLLAGHYLIVDGLLAVDLGDEDTALGVVVKVAAMLSEIRKQAAELGVELP